jgi:hypothetical protein
MRDTLLSEMAWKLTLRSVARVEDETTAAPSIETGVPAEGMPRSWTLLMFISP